MADADESIAPPIVDPRTHPGGGLKPPSRVATRPPGTPGCAPPAMKAAKRDLAGRGAARSAGYAVPASSQSSSTGASRQCGQLTLAASTSIYGNDGLCSRPSSLEALDFRRAGDNLEVHLRRQGVEVGVPAFDLGVLVRPAIVRV